MIRIPRDRLVHIDLFAGCGGLSLGLEHADFVPVYVNELNDDARATYLHNRKHYPWLADENFHSSEIRKITSNKSLDRLRDNLRAGGLGARRVDLLVGGPPCQGFSGIGHRRNYKISKDENPSNYLYREMIKAISGLEPRAFVFENVRGLLTGRWNEDDEPGSIWQSVFTDFKKLERLGYRVAASLLHAGDYGVPQNRPRLMIVGIHKSVRGFNPPTSSSVDEFALDATMRGFLPRPSGLAPPDIADVLGDLVDESYPTNSHTPHYTQPARNGLQRKFRMGLDGRVRNVGAPLSEHFYSKHSDRVSERFRLVQMLHHAGKSIPAELKTKKFNQRVLPLRWNGDQPSITVTSLPDDYIHFSQPRSLTVREWARLQTFPDWYEFHGPRTTGGLRRAGNPLVGLHERTLPKYTQIGNAVPVSMATAVGKHLASILRK